MDLRQLQSFVALAEELHFGRAARRLRISQPALSQQLARLESDLAASLLVRTSREVALTDAGAVLLEPARRAIAAVEEGRTAVADLVAGRTGRLRIGSLSAGLNGPLGPIVARYRERMPTGVVELRHAPDSVGQERALISGELDAAVVRRVLDHRLITSVPLQSEGLVVYVPDTRRDVPDAGVALADLAGESFVLWQRRTGAWFHDAILDACRAHGFEPLVRAYGSTLEAQLALVAAGAGVSLQAESNASVRRAGTRMVPVLDADVRFTLWLAYVDGTLTPPLRVLLDCAADLRREE